MQGLRSPVGLAPPPAYTVPPVSRAKIVFMPVVARRRGYIEIFFSCDLLLILLHRLVAGVAVARETGDIATRRRWSEPAASGTPVTAPPPPHQAPERERHSYGAGCYK